MTKPKRIFFGITVRKCERCGCPFSFRACPSNISLGRGRFCSKNCQKQWQTIPLAVRFKKYVGKPEISGCVPWVGLRNADGYGLIGSGTKNGRNLLAHRVAYEFAHGKIPDGMLILHHCDNPPCINVKHLFLGTHADNHADMMQKGRGRKRVVGSRRYMQELRRRSI